MAFALMVLCLLIFYNAILVEIWYNCVLVLTEEIFLYNIDHYTIILDEEANREYHIVLPFPCMKDVTNEEYYNELNTYFEEALTNTTRIHPFWKRFIKND